MGEAKQDQSQLARFSILDDVLFMLTTNKLKVSLQIGHNFPLRSHIFNSQQLLRQVWATEIAA